MSFRLLLPAARAVRLASFRSTRVASSTSLRFFSEQAEEKPIIPGVGKGKTSTGLVRLQKYYLMIVYCILSLMSSISSTLLK